MTTNTLENYVPTAADVKHVESIAAENFSTNVDASSEYVPAAVSVSCSVGPAGANMQGWITYSSVKVHFEASRIDRYQGLFAGGGGLLMSVLEPREVVGKTGRFKIAGFGMGSSAGTFTCWIGNKLVFGPLPIAGTGFGAFDAEGEMTFSGPQV